MDFYREMGRFGWQVQLFVPQIGASDHPWSMLDEDKGERRFFIHVISSANKLGERWVWLFRKIGFGGSRSAGFSNELFQALRHADPDALLVHEASPFCLGAIIWARLKGKPVWFSSDIGRGSPPHACGFGVKLVHTLVSFLVQLRIANAPPARNGFGRKVKTIFAPHASLLARTKIGEHDERGEGKAVPVLLFVGHVSLAKGVDILLRSVASLSPEVAYKVRIVGTIVDEELVGLANELGLQERVVFTGFKEGEDLALEYSQADIFGFPTRYDTYGVVVHEAASFELPLLVSEKAGAVIPLVEDGISGFCIEDGNVEDFAEKIESLLLDRSLREKLGKGAKILSEEFGVTAGVEKLSVAVS